MPEGDAFEAAYGRLAFTRLAGAQPWAAPTAGREGEPSTRDMPASRLLPRLALMAPSRRAAKPARRP